MRRGYRIAAAIAGAAALAATLVGCAAGSADRLPAALEEADDRVTAVETSTGYEGFAQYLSVGVDIDDDSMTEAQLRAMLTVIADNAGSGFDRISLGVRDGRRPGVHEGYIDLGGLAEQLGLPLADDDTSILIKIMWDDLVAARAGWE